MSGIAGIYHADGEPVEPAILKRMTDAVPWRGPDGIRHHVRGNLGMAHLALHTTPESRYERQPLVTDGEQLWITAHARVDNRRELLAELNLSATDYADLHRVDSLRNRCKSVAEENGPESGTNINSETVVTDVDLILAAYRRWGTDCPRHIIGDFAFALWNAEVRRLFAVRDHMGVRPFYYTWNGRTFAWGTEVKQLLRLPWVSRDLNERMIGLHLVAHPGIPDETFYEQVHQLPPASYLVLEDGQLSVGKYWELDPYKVLELPSDDDYAEAFRELFYQAVEARLRRITPVGIALSGGLDSSAVACVAADILGPEETQRSLHAYTITSDEIPAIDEREYARAVIEKWGIPWTQISADDLAPLEPLPPPAVAVDEDEPLAVHYEAWWAAINLRMCQKQRARILLDGHPGDLLVGLEVIGYDELIRQGRWYSLLQRIRDHHVTLGHPWRILLRETILRPLIPYSWRKVMRCAMRDPLQDMPWVRQGFVKRIHLLDLLKSSDTSPSGIWESRRRRHQYLTGKLIPRVFLYTERFSSHSGIVSCRPWGDVRLVEFVMSLPAEQTFRGGKSKFILRNAMGHRFPSSLQLRLGKTNPSPWWMENIRRASEQEMTVLCQNMLSAEIGYVDEGQLQCIWQQLQSECGGNEQSTIWHTFCLERWMRRFANHDTR